MEGAQGVIDRLVDGHGLPAVDGSLAMTVEQAVEYALIPVPPDEPEVSRR